MKVALPKLGAYCAVGVVASTKVKIFIASIAIACCAAINAHAGDPLASVLDVTPVVGTQYTYPEDVGVNAIAICNPNNYAGNAQVTFIVDVIVYDSVVGEVDHFVSKSTVSSSASAFSLQCGGDVHNPPVDTYTISVFVSWGAAPEPSSTSVVAEDDTTGGFTVIDM